MVKRETPFFSFRRQHSEMRQEISESVERVFESGRFVLGHEGAAFETEFSSYVGASLPLYPSLTDEEVTYIAGVIKDAIS